jgi:hypothetical protein
MYCRPADVPLPSGIYHHVRMSRQGLPVRISVPSIAAPQRAIASQAEAKIERRVKVIQEPKENSRPLDAADVIGPNQAALPLRYLQTLVEIASGKNSTTIFRILIDTTAPSSRVGKELGGRSPDAETNGFDGRKKQRAH